MNYDTTNEMFRLAAELVNQSSRNIFLTGKAGTGKTTFLKYIREHCPKQMAIVAPTGVAAINAGGVTIHSFFQLPLSPFIPEGKTGWGNNEEVTNRHNLVSHLRMTNEKKKVLQQLELLIIDEISMVRCDMLDAIDTVLRHIRQRPRDRFGGVQVLFIGDMLQLPPVIKEQEWNLLSGFYSSPYFFDSKVIKEELPVYVEFNKIYRQSEEKFIYLLNQVRNNELDEEGIEILDSRFQPNFRRTKQDGYIILTTHNDKARDINAIELKKLDGRLFSFDATIEGDFSEKAYPADEILQLKAGAQVMFIKNDTEKIKRYFNGKIGIVTGVEEDKIMVQCKDEPGEIEVKREKWENIRYTLNKTSRQLDEETLGSFTQYPLRLAWSITIHKSQGLTFEKAIIDAGAAFAPGQVYVALSRCTNLEGMILQSRVRSSGLFSDERIVQFSKNSASSHQLTQELTDARKDYQQAILISTFDFTAVINTYKETREYIREHGSSFNEETGAWTEEPEIKMAALQAIARKFQTQLFQLFALSRPGEETRELQARVIAGADHFIKELDQLLKYIQQSPVVTDSRIHAKEYNDGLKELFAQLAMKKHLLEGYKNDFSIEAWHLRKKNFILPPFYVNAYATASKEKLQSPHPLLHLQLRKLRDTICSKKDIPVYMVAGSKTIDEMAEYLPLTLEELGKINGFGPVKIKTYGSQFLPIIQQYCIEHSLSSRIAEKSSKKERKEPKPKEPRPLKVDTKAESYKLYRENKSVSDIARQRNLTTQTIEGHLAHYIETGEIDINQLVSRDKQMLIEPVLKDFNGGSIIPIKEKLGNEISFGEIRLMLAWLAFQKSRNV